MSLDEDTRGVTCLSEHQDIRHVYPVFGPGKQDRRGKADMAMRGRNNTKSVRKDVFRLTMGIIITVLVSDNLFLSLIHI